MFKIAFIIIAIIIAAILGVVGYLGITFWWISRKKPPAYGMIVQKYYVCREYKLLSGGIFGKGPTKQFSGKGTRDWCWKDQWEEIEKEEFMELASHWYDYDWSDEMGLFRRDMD